LKGRGDENDVGALGEEEREGKRCGRRKRMLGGKGGQYDPQSLANASTCKLLNCTIRCQSFICVTSKTNKTYANFEKLIPKIINYRYSKKNYLQCRLESWITKPH
jgi:hypothetical protein